MAGQIYLGTTFIGYYEDEPTENKFGGLYLSPGPMYLTSGGVYGICNTYDEYNSFGTTTSNYPGYKNGYKTYFSLGEIGNKFDSNSNWWDGVYSSGDHTIDNQGTLVSGLGFNDWRLPTQAEYNALIFPMDISASQSTATRIGSTVNGVENVFSALIYVSKTADYGFTSTIIGVLLFPDGKRISGADVFTSTSFYCSASHLRSSYTGFTYMDSQVNPVYPATLTTTQLDNYISQGCGFIPNMGCGFNERATSSLTWANAEWLYNNNYAGCVYHSTNVAGSRTNGMSGSPFIFDKQDNGVWANYMQLDPETDGPKDLANRYHPVYLIRGEYTPTGPNMVSIYVYDMMNLVAITSVGLGWDISDLTNKPPKLYIAYNSLNGSGAVEVTVSSWTLSGNTLTAVVPNDGTYVFTLVNNKPTNVVKS